MTYTPVLKVEIAPGFGPYDEPTGGDWVDITEDVFGVSVRRGRGSEFSQFNAGTATVSLYNDDHKYTPALSSLDLEPNMPIRILAEVNSTDYPVWRGVVDGFPVRFSEGGARAEVELPCTDVFKTLAERPMPDTLAQDLASLSTGVPQNWFRMDVAAPKLLNSQAEERSFLLQSTVSTTEGLGRASSTAVSVPSLTPGSGAKGYVAVLPRKRDEVKWNMTTGVNYSISLLVRHRVRRPVLHDVGSELGRGERRPVRRVRDREATVRLPQRHGVRRGHSHTGIGDNPGCPRAGHHGRQRPPPRSGARWRDWASLRRRCPLGGHYRLAVVVRER
jgi:hypothetical protein